MKDTLYYDGKCPLCASEIRLLMKYKKSSLTLIDIHSQQNNQTLFDKQTLLSVLHMQTCDQRWVKGLDATVRAWRHTHFGILLLPLRWPILKQISDYFYYRWAAKRVCRL